jgi:hypothetical protein
LAANDSTRVWSGEPGNKARVGSEPKVQWPDQQLGGGRLEGVMAAIARAFTRVFPATESSTRPLEIIAIFCGLGLLVSLLVASYGIDLSAGFL